MSDEPPINQEQAKSARVLLGLSTKEVCRTLGITPQTLQRAELASHKDGPASPAIFVRLRRLYEAAGVEFTNGGQPGVRLASASSLTIPGEDLNSSTDE